MREKFYIGLAVVGLVVFGYEMGKYNERNRWLETGEMNQQLRSDLRDLNRDHSVLEDELREIKYDYLVSLVELNYFKNKFIEENTDD